MRMNVSMKGLNKSIQQMNQYTAEKVNAIKAIVAESTQNIENGSVARSPVSEIDGGNLKNGIYKEFADGGFVGRVIDPSGYGLYVEFGTGIYAEGDKPGRSTPWVYFDEKLNRFVFTRGMRAQPFMNPSYEEERPNYIRSLEKELRKP
ncbi:HK97-gp10 family putative phage morphogenesis protein [Bacillus sp. MCCB 382]|uniref:HK97-gp10 family putative phage morphogenesis protein n=1 Tax=Bacillus sp. MCCB 382 TaxID=2860197 RepID=UPI00214BADE0